MSVTAATPIAEAQMLLNDSSGIMYTSTILIPMIQKAYRELQVKMSRNGLGVTKEVSSPIDIPPNTVELISGGSPALPADLLYPIWLKEKANGAPVDQYVDMEERDWEVTDVPTTMLRFWSWREETIKFIGATVDVDVLIQYRKSLPVITAPTTVIQILDSETFLAARTAAIASAVVGENYTRAGFLNSDATLALEDLINPLVKRRQSTPVRRRRTRYRA